MKTATAFATTCAVLTGAVLLSVLPVRSQNAAAPVAVVEQYRILSGRLPNTGQFKTDAQMQAELNALAAEGWKVRAANENAIILAR
jgi:hypothetical protein